MELTKDFLHNALIDATRLYKKKVMRIANIEIKFVTEEFMLEQAERTPIIQALRKCNLIDDLGVDYPLYMAVFPYDKSPMSVLFSNSYKVSVCFETAQRIFEKAETFEVRDYLIHCFAHEITHIYQEQLKKARPELWEKCLSEGGNEYNAHEFLAEEIADIVMNTKNVETCEQKIWGKFYEIMHKFQQSII